MPDQPTTMATINGLLANRPVTVVAVIACFAAATTYTSSISTQSVGGSLSGQMPNPTIALGAITSGMLAPGVGGGSVFVVPNRVVTGTSPAATTVTDFLVVLNGPSEVDLENAPPSGTTHVIKQASSGAAVNIVAASGSTIDGAANLSFPTSAAHPSITVSYTSLGWQAY